jgi:hypothetical protein
MTGSETGVAMPGSEVGEVLAGSETGVAMPGREAQLGARGEADLGPEGEGGPAVDVMPLPWGGELPDAGQLTLF